MTETTAQPVPTEGVPMSLEEYHAFEDSHPGKYEYVSGWVYAQAGANQRHNDLQMNVLGVLHAAARRDNCRARGSDMKLRTPGGAEYYPDAMVVCGPVDPLAHSTSSPLVLVEITSQSTARIDRDEKLDAYCAIPTLRAYLIISQSQRRLDVYWRDSESSGFEHGEITEGTFWLSCLDANLVLDELYA